MYVQVCVRVCVSVCARVWLTGNNVEAAMLLQCRYCQAAICTIAPS